MARLSWSRVAVVVSFLFASFQCFAVTVTPGSVTVNENATQQFTSSVPSTWTTTCGSISSAGLFKAWLYPRVCTITATATNGSGSATASVTVVSPIVMTPASATTPQGQTQQFRASASVTWSAGCGSITASGLYTASGTVGQNCKVEGIATVSPKYTVYGYDRIGSPTGTFSISPLNPSVTEGATKQFSASSAATFAATCGTISSTGLYTAPLLPESCAITATSTTGKGTASTSATVTSPITITPASASTVQGKTQQFTANAAVKWSATCGTISAGGLFTASGTVGSKCTIEAIATGTPAYTAFASDTTTASSVFSISPLNPVLAEGGTQQFTASSAATFSATCGTITAAGFYTAPMTEESCIVKATATNGSGDTASTSVTVTGSLAISPANPSLFALNTQQFTANRPVTWSTSCGTINASTGLFTAPSAAGDCTVTAKSTSSPVATAATQVAVSLINYPTFRGDNSRTGSQTQERVLTPANVNSTSFGLAWSLALDSGIWSQPLYMNALTVNGGVHNVVYSATANDSIYAIDGDTGALLWKRSFLSTGVTAVPGSLIHHTINPVGIIGTPVIDPTTLILYAVAMTAENNDTLVVFRLHAISATTGQEMPDSPVVISAPMFVAGQQTQRPGLLVANGRVYVAFGSIQDRLPYHGFLFAFDAGTLQLDAVFNTDPDTDATGGGGIWMSSMGPVADTDGNVYLSTANGPTDDKSDFGQSVLKLSPQLDVLDYFTPYNHVAQSSGDLDLGSAGVIIVPDQTSGPYTHELIACGKPNSIYVINRDALGGTGTTKDNIIQRVDEQLGQVGNWTDAGEACYSTVAFWNQKVYIGANHDYLKMFALDAYTGLLTTSPVSIGPTIYTYPGTYPTISANGNIDGIVWTYEPTSGTLRASDATDVTKELFVGTVYSKAKWVAPTVVNGHVYIAMQNKVFAFALK